MAPITRKAAAEQKTAEQKAEEQKSKKKVPKVLKTKKNETKVGVSEKWTKQDELIRKGENGRGLMRQRDEQSLASTNEEIEKWENAPESPEKLVMLTSARARKEAIEKKLGIWVQEVEMVDDEEEDRDDEGGHDGEGSEPNEYANEQGSGITQNQARASIEGNSHHLDEADTTTEKLFNNIPWYIRESSPIESSPTNSEGSAPIGYLKKGSSRLYLVRYGTPGRCSTRFESNPISLSEHPEQSLVDVACRKHRIIEKIIQWHKDNGMPLPDDVLSKAQILNVYWDSKHALGSDVEADLHDFLGPKPQSRTSVRCFVYLDPQLYAGKGWGVENLSGFSHETRTTMLSCIGGIRREDREIGLYDTAVKLENRYQRMFQPTEEALSPYDRQISRRTSPRRSTTRQPSHARESPEVFQTSQNYRYEASHPDHARPSEPPERPRQGTPALTEKSLMDMIERCMKQVEEKLTAKLENTLVDTVVDKVLERLKQVETM